MPQYKYTALSHSGALVAGESASASPDALKAELETLGLRAEQIRRTRKWTRLWQRNEVSTEEFLLFVRELLSLARAGLPLTEALALTADRPGAPALGRVLDRVLKDVQGGMLFSQACTAHPDVFDGHFLGALKTGEKTGELPTVLSRHLEFLRRRVVLRKKISQAIAYPVFLLITLSTIIGVMFAFVMPRFVSMYASFDAKLPAPTRWLLSIAENFPAVALAVGAFGALALYGWRSISASSAGRLKIDQGTLRAPFVGGAVRTAAVANLARSLAALLAGGTPLLEALRTVQDSFPNRAFALQAAEVADRVTQGDSFAQAVRRSGLMPETAIKMLQVGEASGSLDRMLAEIAQHYEDELEDRLSRVTALVEPALMLLMGIMIGGIIIVMYLPIFNLAEVIR